MTDDDGLHIIGINTTTPITSISRFFLQHAFSYLDKCHCTKQL